MFCVIVLHRISKRARSERICNAPLKLTTLRLQVFLQINGDILLGESHQASKSVSLSNRIAAINIRSHLARSIAHAFKYAGVSSGVRGVVVGLLACSRAGNLTASPYPPRPMETVFAFCFTMKHSCITGAAMFTALPLLGRLCVARNAHDGARRLPPHARPHPATSASNFAPSRPQGSAHIYPRAPLGTKKGAVICGWEIEMGSQGCVICGWEIEMGSQGRVICG